MQYMIIEKFYPGKVKALYDRFEKEGRLLPEGVQYINSWINETVTACYQVMESESLEKLHEWIALWKEFASFEIIPVISSAEAKKRAFSA